MNTTVRNLAYSFNDRDSMRDALATMLSEVQQEAESRGVVIAEETRHALCFIFTEAWMNHVVHGNKGDAAKQVTVHGELGEEENGRLYLKLISADQGEGFSVADVPWPNRSDSTGRGVKSLRDYVGKLSGALRYNATGNQVQIQVRIQKPDHKAMYATVIQDPSAKA